MNQINNNDSETTKVEFQKAKYSKRLFAFGADVLCMAFVGLLLVILAQFIALNSPSYKAINNTINDVQSKSGLYQKDDNDYVILTNLDEYKNPKTEEDYRAANKVFKEALENYYTNFVIGYEKPNDFSYDLFNNQKKEKGDNLFIINKQGKYVESEYADQKDLYSFYVDALGHRAVQYLMTIPEYRNANVAITLIFVFLELLIPISISVFIFEFFIPVFDSHGRRTLGKRLFKIGIVNAKGLTPSKRRFLLRFSFLFFIEILLSIPSFLIPIILSFSMTSFSKTGQSLHDYVLGTYVVDISESFICKTKEEYIKKHSLGEKYSPMSKDLIIK